MLGLGHAVKLHWPLVPDVRVQQVAHGVAVFVGVADKPGGAVVVIRVADAPQLAAQRVLGQRGRPRAGLAAAAGGPGREGAAVQRPGHLRHLRFDRRPGGPGGLARPRLAPGNPLLWEQGPGPGPGDLPVRADPPAPVRAALGPQ